jgi:SAM-dependent methyltransferase
MPPLANSANHTNPLGSTAPIPAPATDHARIIEPRLTIPRAHARALHIGFRPLIATKTRQYLARIRGRDFHGHGLIGADPDRVRQGFERLAQLGFDQYNFPQVWVERRQIPRVLHGRVPQRNAVILDLGCGPGTSTEVLAHFAHPTWHILGFDLTPHSIDAARRRAEQGHFRSRDGHTIRPTFICQNIAHPLTFDGTPPPRGQPLPDRFADLAIAGGVVGLYMSPRQAGRLLANLARIVKPGGAIALDAGPSVPQRAMLRLARRAGLRLAATVGSVPLDPRPKLVFVHV